MPQSTPTKPQSSALRQLKKLLRSGKQTLDIGGRSRHVRRRIARTLIKLRSASANALQRLMPRLRISEEVCRKLHATLLLVSAISLIVLFLISSVGCAVKPPDVPQIQPCRVPLAPLQPTLEPEMNDATGENLVEEAHQLREGLRACNQDKEEVKRYLLERGAKNGRLQ